MLRTAQFSDQHQHHSLCLAKITENCHLNTFIIHCSLNVNEMISTLNGNDVDCTPVCRLCGRYLALLSRPISQTAKHGILDEISLVRDHSGWCGFGADYGILVRCGEVLMWCGAMRISRNVVWNCKWCGSNSAV